MEHNSKIQAKKANLEAGLENGSRRKAVKSLVCAATALAAYHVFPVRWNKPLIEQVFLPAHAATSSMVQGSLNGTVEVIYQAFGQITPGAGDSLLATIPKAVGQFFVADARANGHDTQSWCVTISGNTATYLGYAFSSITVNVSGSVTATVEYSEAGYHFYLRIIDSTASTIQVEVKVVVSGGEYLGNGWLTLGNGCIS